MKTPNSCILKSQTARLAHNKLMNNNSLYKDKKKKKKTKQNPNILL